MEFSAMSDKTSSPIQVSRPQMQFMYPTSENSGFGCFLTANYLLVKYYELLTILHYTTSYKHL